jgi:hypothetical protein
LYQGFKKYRIPGSQPVMLDAGKRKALEIQHPGSSIQSRLWRDKTAELRSGRGVIFLSCCIFPGILSKSCAMISPVLTDHAPMGYHAQNRPSRHSGLDTRFDGEPKWRKGVVE